MDNKIKTLILDVKNGCFVGCCVLTTPNIEMIIYFFAYKNFKGVVGRQHPTIIFQDKVVSALQFLKFYLF